MNTAPKEALTGRDSSESLLLYSISLISILIASLDLVDLYLMPTLFISRFGLPLGGPSPLFISRWDGYAPLDQTNLTKGRDA